MLVVAGWRGEEGGALTCLDNVGFKSACRNRGGGGANSGGTQRGEMICIYMHDEYLDKQDFVLHAPRFCGKSENAGPGRTSSFDDCSRRGAHQTFLL